MTDFSDRELTVTRLINAPRELVFEVWTDPRHLAAWWGPRGFVTDIQNSNIAPGGGLTFTMKGPDGHVWPNHILYLEVERPARLVWSHGSHEGKEEGRFLNTVTFADEGGRTRLTMTARLPSKEIRDALVRDVNAAEAGKQTIDKLEEYLASAEQDQFTLTRIFAAPRDRVWRAWTEREALAQWWGPKDFGFGVAAFDLRPGGVFLYRVDGPEGTPMAGTTWAKFVFREISAPERLAWVSSFCDERGETIRFPLFADWPLEVFTVLTLAEKDGRTTLTLRATPINATDAERERFAGFRASMRIGYAGTWDKLDAFLQRAA